MYIYVDYLFYLCAGSRKKDEVKIIVQDKKNYMYRHHIMTLRISLLYISYSN